MGMKSINSISLRGIPLYLKLKYLAAWLVDRSYPSGWLDRLVHDRKRIPSSDLTVGASFHYPYQWRPGYQPDFRHSLP